MSIDPKLKLEAIALLKSLIKTPSISKSEGKTAEIISAFFNQKKIAVSRYKNNIWVESPNRNPERPTLLLNSHHDTVKPVTNWKKDPFSPQVENGILYGLGSNDAGGSLVALMAVYLHFYAQKNLPINLVFLASAEEEISGKNGVEAVLPKLGKIDFGIVGEPTEMQMAVAEKGLIVLDGIAKGKAGHAARNEGDNAIYRALKDIQYLKNFKFEKISEKLGAIKISVTQINAGSQHNVVPDHCQFVVDVRTTEAYSNSEVLNYLNKNTYSTLEARSLRLEPSSIPSAHPLVQAGKKLGITTFGSSTLSDQSLMNFPTLKMGPGNSNRSHTADEFILLSEIENGIDLYSRLISELISFYKKQTL